MKHKIFFKDFLRTFTKKQLEDIKDYNLVMELHNKGYTRRQIMKKVNVSLDKLHQWRNTSTKPCPIKVLEKATNRDYFKFISEDRLEKLSYLVGYNLGDGNISRNLCNTWFYGVNTDLENIRKILIYFKIEPVIYTYKFNNGKMAVHDHAFSRFLVCLGAIIGDKTQTSFKVPEWIIKSGYASKIKQKFLQGFFDSELSNVKLDRNKPFSHKSLKLYTCKGNSHINGGIFFLNQIRDLLKEFDVISSDIKFDKAYIRGRDNELMQQLFLSINSNYINLYNFIKNIGFLYNFKRKKNSLENFSQIEVKAKFELEKIRKYKEVIRLRKKGLSAYKIANKLGLNVYYTKSWIYFGKRPRLYNFNETLNNS